MNNMNGPEGTKTSPFLGWPLGEMTLDIAQRFWDHNQTIAKALATLNSEVAEFVGQRLSQDSATVGRTAQCQSLRKRLRLRLNGGARPSMTIPLRPGG